MNLSKIPIVGICGHKNSGKTLLIVELIKHFNERGLQVAVIKQENHQLALNNPKQDSYQFQQAGAQQVLLTSNQRWSLLYEREQAQQPNIEAHIADLQTEHLDLVLVESDSGNTFPKIEVHRPIQCKPLLFPNQPLIKAVATDSPLILAEYVTQLNLNDSKCIADYIHEEIIAAHH